MIWHLLESGRCAADFNMAMDEALLECAASVGTPVLRFYGWTEPAATFGYSQKYAFIEQVTRLRPLIRRPTGGGLVPHDADWTYSLAFPPSDPWHGLKAVESYKKVHEWIRDAFAIIGVKTMLAPVAQKDVPGQCFIGAEKSDVLWNGRKIAGAAQRRNHFGLLIQGSVQPPLPELSRDAWEKAMLGIAETQFGVQWIPLAADPQVNSHAAKLRAEKYSRLEFNRSR
jgi:lipoate-protein ligase A